MSMQEHMAINVNPGPIRPIRLISDYFPHFYPFTEPALRAPDPHPAVAPTVHSAPQPQPEPEPEGDSDDSSEQGQGMRTLGPAQPGWGLRYPTHLTCEGQGRRLVPLWGFRRN